MIFTASSRIQSFINFTAGFYQVIFNLVCHPRVLREARKYYKVKSVILEKKRQRLKVYCLHLQEDGHRQRSRRLGFRPLQTVRYSGRLFLSSLLWFFHLCRFKPLFFKTLSNICFRNDLGISQKLFVNRRSITDFILRDITN